MAAECGFSWRVELVAFRKEGFSHLGKMVDNLVSRGKELPGNAYFRTPLERRVNQRTGREELFWQGYGRSIRESMRRNVAWLRLNKASAEKIEQAKSEYHDWVEAEKTVLDSNGHIPVRFFSAKDGDATLGMALHQVSRQDGELVLESQLLPIEQMDQMEFLMGSVEKVREPINFKQELPMMIRESLLVNQQDLGMPIHTMTESMSGGVGIGMGDVHLGSGHEEVSVTEAPKYQAPVVVFSAVEEMITEVVQPHPRGGNVDEVIKSVKPEAVIWAKPRDIVVEQPVVPSVVTPVLVANELQTREDTEVTEGTEKFSVAPDDSVVSVIEEAFGIIQDKRIELVITEGTELTESTEKVVVPTVTRMILVSGEASEVTVTELPKYEEITEATESFSVVSDRITAPVIEEASGVEIDDRIEGVITEGTEVIEGTEIVIFSAVSDQVSALSVIREAFNIELVTEHKQSLLLRNKSVKSVKDKLIWLGRNMANIVADQLMGRKMQEKKDKNVFGWLVHGLAMMQFDGIEEKRKMRRFSLSPVRVWADRVTKVVKRVKSKFRQSVYGAYNHLFVTT